MSKKNIIIRSGLPKAEWVAPGEPSWRERIEAAAAVPNNPDPWAHRSEGMKCKTCMWFVPKGDKGLGRCRRHAPTMGGYPAVFNTDWCGDHKLDESKLA